VHVTLIDTKSYFEYTPAAVRVLCKPKLFNKLVVPHRTYLNRGSVVVGAVAALHSHDVVVGNRVVEFDIAVVCTGIEYPCIFQSGLQQLSSRRQAMQGFHDKLMAAKRLCIAGGGSIGCEMVTQARDANPDISIVLVHSHDRLLNRLIASEG